ncbi:protein OSCP1-like isoform X4 [Crassostrea angulata]|uniref:Protein OSCP1 n=1 Tax=Magallana gigas TaxID=29159 RepID=K1PW99_MAGGI|nr:protein OSCP1 isoform X4 [Crassostrea gigas]XP_052709052.1 protein OSCP1-like isoform X4 [Crassostrea angulata]
MSYKTLPLLFINLGGEMIYILDQRLRAQNIPNEKSRKVLHDIISTMFHKRFMEELFKPQPLYSKKAMRTVFDRLAHASIMRLNAPSMDKLYDLMTMAFKYQVSLCLRPKEIILITLNHMDAIRAFVEGQPNIKQQVDHVYRLLIQTFGSLSNGEFQLIRQTLLNFFQDMHIRVSIFLKDKVQNSNGRFVLPTGGAVPYGAEVPGTIKLFNASGAEVKTSSFNPGGSYQPPQGDGSLDIVGNRITTLGTNMYSVSRPVETSGSHRISKSAPTVSDIDSATPDPMAKAQLDLLCQLIGSSAPKSEIRLNLFKTDEEEEQASVATIQPVEHAQSKVVNIDLKKNKNDELSRIAGELSIQGDQNEAEDDLLNLMDSA